MVTKVPPATNRPGMFTKDDFGVDVDRERVVCPAGCIVPIRFSPDGSGRAEFGFRCAGCPQRERCTTSPSGRTVKVHRREDILQRKKREQATGTWETAYRGTRPKVEGRSPTSCGSCVADGKPAPEDVNASRPTRSPGPPPSTWPGWRLSTSPSPTAGGPQPPHNRGSTSEVRPDELLLRV